MDQIYPLPGVQSCSDYIDNWVDKTIEKEIQRGKKLQELKEHPTTRSNKYHIVNVKGTNFYCEKKQSKRSSQSNTKQTRKVQNHSPHGTNLPTRNNKSKKDSQRCPMRTAELAVPSKRHCIETWQNNYHILPGIMIDRLKNYVFDMTPVVKIPDAIDCFERCENSKRRKRKMKKAKRKNRNKKTKDKSKTYVDCFSNHTTFEGDPKLPTRIQQQRQDLCISFGTNIAKKLYRPTIITLNPELQKISNVITEEIEDLMRNENKCGCYNNELRRLENKRIEAEIIAKITVWISEILDDTADKILEDQLRDLDEEIGPVLDFLDDLIDKVLDICEPEPVIVEKSPSRETLKSESSTEYVDDIDGDYELLPKESRASLDLAIFLKKELDVIINSFDKDYPEDDNIALQNDEDNSNQNEIEGRENAVDGEKKVSMTLDPFSRPRHILKGTVNDTDDTMPLEVNEQNEFQDARNEPENEESNADQRTEVNETINLESNELDDDDLNKKVKFSEKGLVTNYDSALNETADSNKSDFMNLDIVLAEPNDHLLSDADESWPEDLISPVVRPSVSVSKSISSLGFVVEAEERTSIMLFDTGATLLIKRTENDIDDTKPLEKLNEHIEARATDKDTSEIAAYTYGETEEGIKERTEQSMKYPSKDPQKIEEDLAEKVADGISQRASTDSTFIGDVSSEPITFEKTLEKITEDEAPQAALDKIVHDETTQASKPEKDKAEMSDKTTYTSFSLIQREDKSTTVISQSLANIAKRLSSGKPEFSSLRIKPKVDYKVNKDSAPAWVTQNFSQPRPKEDPDKHIRLWCKDLQTGFENLELWNEWLENTLGNVEIMERDRARIEVYETREEFIREWIHLKKNVDADVVTWIKHSHSTQEKIKCFRKVCKNFQEPSSNVKTCNCNKK